MSNPLMEAMQQLQLVQQKMAEAKASLGGRTVSEEGAGGAIRITVNGLGRLTALEIAPALLAADEKEALEDLLLTTINRAIESSKTMANDELSRATQGLMPNIPGLEGL